MRTGRPKKEEADKASRLLSVRLTPDTMEWLKNAASAEGKSVTEYVQQLIYERIAESHYG